MRGRGAGLASWSLSALICKTGAESPPYLQEAGGCLRAGCSLAAGQRPRQGARVFARDRMLSVWRHLFRHKNVQQAGAWGSSGSGGLQQGAAGSLPPAMLVRHAT